MHYESLADLQIEAYLQSELNLPAHVAIEDVRANKESLIPSQDNPIIVEDNK